MFILVLFSCFVIYINALGVVHMPSPEGRSPYHLRSATLTLKNNFLPSMRESLIAAWQIGLDAKFVSFPVVLSFAVGRHPGGHCTAINSFARNDRALSAQETLLPAAFNKRL